MIELDAVTYRYPQAAAPVLDNFCAAFAPGCVTALRGNNGSGKTTLSKLIAGILRPQSGAVRIDGVDIAGLSLFAIGQRVGYIWQNPNQQLFSPSAVEEVAFGLRQQGMPAAEADAEAKRWLARFRLSGREQAHPLQLSLGEKQRLAFAAVLALGAPYLLLDEPTGGLDVRGRRQLGALLRQLAAERGAGVVIISHEADFIRRYADGEVWLPC